MLLYYQEIRFIFKKIYNSSQNLQCSVRYEVLIAARLRFHSSGMSLSHQLANNYHVLGIQCLSLQVKQQNTSSSAWCNVSMNNIVKT